MFDCLSFLSFSTTWKRVFLCTIKLQEYIHCTISLQTSSLEEVFTEICSYLLLKIFKSHKLFLDAVHCLMYQNFS